MIAHVYDIEGKKVTYHDLVGQVTTDTNSGWVRIPTKDILAPDGVCVHLLNRDHIVKIEVI